jgi:hypothetical protein
MHAVMDAAALIISMITAFLVGRMLYAWFSRSHSRARPDVRVRRQPVEVARLEVSSKAFCNATGVAPMKEPIPRH